MKKRESVSRVFLHTMEINGKKCVVWNGEFIEVNSPKYLKVVRDFLRLKEKKTPSSTNGIKEKTLPVSFLPHSGVYETCPPINELFKLKNRHLKKETPFKTA